MLLPTLLKAGTNSVVTIFKLKSAEQVKLTATNKSDQLFKRWLSNVLEEEAQILDDLAKRWNQSDCGYYLTTGRMEAADFMIEVDYYKPEIIKIARWLKEHSEKIIRKSNSETD